MTPLTPTRNTLRITTGATRPGKRRCGLPRRPRSRRSRSFTTTPTMMTPSWTESPPRPPRCARGRSSPRKAWSSASEVAPYGGKAPGINPKPFVRRKPAPALQPSRPPSAPGAQQLCVDVHLLFLQSGCKCATRRTIRIDRKRESGLRRARLVVGVGGVPQSVAKEVEREDGQDDRHDRQ